jgi:HEAT repeat protein
MLDEAFDALKSYDWGPDRKTLNPIDEAVVATQDDAAARKELEARLVAALQADTSRAAKDFICRKLMVIGTAASVPALAKLLPLKEHSHMARYALERIPTGEAVRALRDALPKLDGELKIGVIGSLGTRRDAGSVSALADLLDDADATVGRSAAYALGAIGSPEAVQVLQRAKPSDAKVKQAVIDASLSCAETLLAAGRNAEAMLIYKSFMGEDQPKQVRLAATRGMLECAGKKE